MSYQVLARKWRPRNFTTLVGQEHVVKALTHALTENRLHHAYLFTGTRGVGKTTIARILAKSINCETGITSTPCGQCNTCLEIDAGRFVDLLEIDAATNTRVDDMRQLLETAVYAPTRGRYKVYVIDEVHMLSNSAFNAMLKTLEEPPTHVKFILATTDPQKIPVTVLSRCLQFNLKQMPELAIAQHLGHILSMEGIQFDSAALNRLAKSAHGSMRDGLSLLDQAIAHGAGQVTESSVVQMLGAVDISCVEDILFALLDKDANQLVSIADNLLLRSISYSSVLQELSSYLTRLQIQSFSRAASLEIDEINDERFCALSRAFSPQYTQLAYQICNQGRSELMLAPDPRSGFVMTVLRLLAFRPQTVSEFVSSCSSGPVRLSSHSSPVSTEEIQIAPAVNENNSHQKPTHLELKPETWVQIVNQLDLSPMPRQLAINSRLTSIDAGVCQLSIHVKNSHLQMKSSVDSLQQVIAKYLNSPVLIKFTVIDSEVETPALKQQRLKDRLHLEAVHSIRNDEFVIALQQGLDAQLIDDTIKPIHS